MTEKRFTYMEQFNGFCDVYDNGKVLSCMRLEYVDKTVDLLNEQHETISELSSQKDYLLNENKHMRELVNEKERLVKMLDNVANYMQREHREMPLDDFVEWWNNIATEGLE